MPRIALGQLNLTVGDLAGNVEAMAASAARAAEAEAELVCFPELSVTGYPPEDLVLRPEFVRDNLAALEELAAKTADACPVIAGFVDRSERGLHNAAAFLAGGEVRARYHKIVLPNFGVFDEQRYFVPGERTEQVTVGGISVGLSVCEDVWHAGRPFSEYAGVPLVTNINGSPYHRRKLEERLGVLRDRAREFGGWIAYVNAVGGQDEIVFDGGSVVVGPDGEVACRAPFFEEDLLVVDVDDSGARAERDGEWIEPPGSIYRALVLGLRDYVRKNGFDDVVLGLSGGIDSAFVAVVAADALGPDGVRVLAMPSPYSSGESLEDAADVAGRLGVRLDTASIDRVFDAYRSTLAPLFEGREADVTEENLQARIRGNLLMAVSNKFGSLVLATGNKSEYAVGYSTLYGDMAGGFAPVKDVPKTLLYELARWRNAEGPGEPFPERVLTKPPSAELRPDQKDTDSLPPYEDLDPIIEAYVEDDLGVDEIVEGGHDRATVERIVRMIDRAEYKRRQAAPGIKITPKAFGRDRRMPITNRYVD
ncbi:MAG TPA: NAD+ synthase [Actinomycetota bacterium]|nr:NAD+ synthase [Actinomycetota bacterium]